MGLLTRVSSTNVENLICSLDILSDNILEAGVALIPVELLLVFLVTVLPVLLLSVLGHFLLLIVKLDLISFHLIKDARM